MKEKQVLDVIKKTVLTIEFWNKSLKITSLIVELRGLVLHKSAR